MLLTLVINGTTTGFVIKKLGLKRENEFTQLILTQILDLHDEKTNEFINKYFTEHKSETIKRDDIITIANIPKTKEKYKDLMMQ